MRVVPRPAGTHAASVQSRSRPDPRRPLRPPRRDRAGRHVDRVQGVGPRGRGAAGGREGPAASVCERSRQLVDVPARGRDRGLPRSSLHPAVHRAAAEKEPHSHRDRVRRRTDARHAGREGSPAARGRGAAPHEPALRGRRLPARPAGGALRSETRERRPVRGRIDPPDRSRDGARGREGALRAVECGASVRDHGLRCSRTDSPAARTAERRHLRARRDALRDAHGASSVRGRRSVRRRERASDRRPKGAARTLPGHLSSGRGDRASRPATRPGGALRERGRSQGRPRRSPAGGGLGARRAPRRGHPGSQETAMAPVRDAQRRRPARAPRRGLSRDVVVPRAGAAHSARSRPSCGRVVRPGGRGGASRRPRLSGGSRCRCPGR